MYDVETIDAEILRGDYDHLENSEEVIAIYKAQVEDQQ